jgi:hypothetical protein
MLKRLIQWLKRFFERLFGGTQTAAKAGAGVQKEPPPPLTDTDLEFLFAELLEGVHQARGQAWAIRWLQNIEGRVSTESWVRWLESFSEKLLASPTPNNELAARMVQLGELEVGDVGDVAYDIGMQLLTRNQAEPIFEYEGPDLVPIMPKVEETSNGSAQNHPEGELETITLEQLFVMLQQDENLRQMVSQQLGIETDDPNVIVQALVEQFQADNQSPPDDAQT